LNEVTGRFLDVLIENKRLDALTKIADKYIDYYRILNKEETIRIISAEELSKD
jgi:F0F1-type ATP synthase delta subunit